MEQNILSDNKTTLCIDARKADVAFVEQLNQFLSKTKQEVEIFCVGYNGTSPHAKLKYMPWQENKTLAQNFDDALAQASGGLSLLVFHTNFQAGTLLQHISTHKKALNQEKISIGSANLQAQSGKTKLPIATRLFNSITRIFTPITGSDCLSGVIVAKTKWLSGVLQNQLIAANSYAQFLNLCNAYKISKQEFGLNLGETKTSLPWMTLLTQIFSLRWNYFVKDAALQMKSGTYNYADGNHPIYRMLFFVTFLLISFAMPYLSQDFGSTWDEKAHNDYSQLAYRYLTTFGEDTAALAEPANGGEYIRQAYRFYGEQLNTVAAFAYNTFGTGVYETRHLINSLYGLLGIIFTALIAFELAGWRAGLIAMLFMFFNPGWMGHSMNNPTDIPFATGFAFAGYFMLKVLRTLPAPLYRNLLWLAVGIGIGLASRVGALLLLAYFGLFLGINWLHWFRQKDSKAGKLIIPYAKLFLVVGVIGYVVGILIWPYALDNPFSHPMEAFKKASENAFYTNNVELFEGKRMYMITSAPWYYVFKFLGMGNPLYLIVGVILSIALFIPLRKKIGIGTYAMLMFMLFFPILYAEYSNLNYYNGWRHYLFILPFAIGLAASSWDYLLGLKKPIGLSVGILLTILFGKPALWIVQNHPNQYVYFNELVGGLKGAFGEYETDYYSNSCREAAEWIATQHPKDTLIVGINNETTTASYWAHQINPNLNFVWTREMEEQKQPWDYLILTTRTFSKNELQNGSFPPAGTVYVVEAEGVPLAAVIKRENWNMPRGYNALDKMSFDSAIYYFEEAVRYSPKDEESWRMLGFALLNKPTRLDSAEKMLLKSIEIYPENFTAYSNLGLVYFNKKEFQKAADTFKKSTDLKENVVESWYYAALAYLNMNDYTNGINCLEMAKKHSSTIPEVYYYLGKAYMATNNLDKASENYQYALGINQNFVQAWGELAQVFQKQGNNAAAQECMNRYRALGGQ
jgi:tetratricopeptide (TPR) repeat protein